MSTEAALNHFELNTVLPIVKDALIQRYKNGFRNEISGSKMISILAQKANISINPSRLRKIIHRITLNGLEEDLVLCATSKGYYLTNERLKYEKYKRSLKERIESQMVRFDAVEKQVARIEKRKQLRLIDIFYPKQKVTG